jgi:hypothetical protein
MAFIEPHSIKRAGYDNHQFGRTLLMKTEKIGHHEATQALVLSGDGHYADSEFDFADLVLSACSDSKAVGGTVPTALPSSP